MMNKHTMKHHLQITKKQTKALSFQTGKNMASLFFFYKRTTQNPLQLSFLFLVQKANLSLPESSP